MKVEIRTSGKGTLNIISNNNDRALQSHVLTKYSVQTLGQVRLCHDTADRRNGLQIRMHILHEPAPTVNERWYFALRFRDGLITSRRKTAY